jgi:photosystem II stability/assembly factor-like uncharacterized protein
VVALSLVLVLAVPSPVFGAYVGKWFWQNPIPQGDYLYAADFAGDNGWAVGRGVVLRSLSGGSQWSVQYGFPEMANRDFWDVEVVDNNNVWILSSDGAWFHSSDAGQTWVDRRPAPVSRPCSIEFFDANTGWVADSKLGAMRTTDGGSTWTTTSVPCASPNIIVRNGNQMIMSDGQAIVRVDPFTGDSVLLHTELGGVGTVVFADADSLVSIDYMGLLSRSDDGGRTWTSRRPFCWGNPIGITSLFFVSPTVGFCSSGPEGIWRTLDGGRTWAPYQPAFYNRAGVRVQPMFGLSNPVYANGRLLSVGAAGGIMYSTNYGASWRFVSGDFFDNLLCMNMESSSSGLVLGELAAYRTSDGGATWARQPMPAVRRFRAASFAPNLSGWVVGDDRSATTDRDVGVVFRTVNGGRTYVKQTVPSSFVSIHAVWTNDGITAWAGGESSGATRFSGILKTTDRGVTWRQCSIDWSGMALKYPTEDRPIYSITVHPSGIGYARATNERQVLETTDAGRTWHDARLKGADAMITMVSSDTVIASVGGALYTKKHPSTSWVKMADVSTATVTDLKFLTRSVGYAIAGGRIYRTDDCGATWTESNRGGYPWALATAGETDAWAVGYGGTVLYNGGLAGDFVPPTTRTNAPVGWDDTAYKDVSLSPADKTGIDSTWWAFGEPSVPAMLPAALGSTGGGLGYVPYKGRIRVSAEGVTPITFYSRDANGNLEQPRTVRVRLDRRSPTVSSDAKTVYGGKARIRITSQDAGCGVRATYYSIDGKTPVRISGAVAYAATGLGAHSVTYWAVDRLGHASAKVVRRFSVLRLASLSPSALPTTVTVGVPFTVAGYVYPRHALPTRVAVRAYHFNGSSWTLGPVISTYTRNNSTGSKYSVRMTLPGAGMWRVRASHYCPRHYYSASPHRYTTCASY